ncbi:RNA polymerase sigma factor [Rubritalea marina]|uniref:RNA polymerase sigma factor n=1 Tax=Rubritalea marina TaxID=361055 RepID=UPI00036F8995|nr:RNA polymerase sigma factor [Rubritalea marina]
MDEDQDSMGEASAQNQKGLAWESWLREHGSKLLLFARQQTRSHADAEDILQEALVKLVQKVNDGSFSGGQEAWLPYLYTAIRRNAIDLGRKVERRGKREEKAESEKMHDTGGVQDPWFQSAEAESESSAYIEQSIKKLPPKFAEVITMKIWGERTFAEIGEALDISQNTAASRYRYGLAALKKLLDDERKNGHLAIN